MSSASEIDPPQAMEPPPGPAPEVVCAVMSPGSGPSSGAFLSTAGNSAAGPHFPPGALAGDCTGPSETSTAIGRIAGDEDADNGEQVADLLADQMHRFDQQQRLFRLRVEQQSTALTERTLDLERRESELRLREAQLVEREVRQAQPQTPAGVASPTADPPPAADDAGARSRGQPAGETLPRNPPRADSPATDPLSTSPEVSTNRDPLPVNWAVSSSITAPPPARPDSVEPGAKSGKESGSESGDEPADVCDARLEQAAALAREREELHREKLLFESRIRFQQEHLQRTLRDLEGRQHRFRREQQQGQARLVERENLLALRARQLQTAVERITGDTSGLSRAPADLSHPAVEHSATQSPPHSTAPGQAEEAWHRDRQAWEQSRQQQQAALDEQRSELALVVQELDHRRQQLLELYATVERARAQLAAAEEIRESKANLPTETSLPQDPVGTPLSIPVNAIAADSRIPAEPASAEFVGEPAEIVVVEHAGAGDVAFEADYSMVYRPLAPSAEEQTAGLREELAALQSQLQAERDGWARERLQWTQWADALEARHARELDQHRQRDEQWQQEAERWQADRDEARAVIVDLLARVNAVTAHS